jgi:peptide/nickel transport system ATP-binding protein
MKEENIIEIKDVCIDYKMKKYDIRAVDNVSLNIKRGKITALVGESGSGKTTLVSSILRCISEPGVLSSGEIIFHGKDKKNDEINTRNIMKLTDKNLNAYRWGNVSMVFQAAQSALNPVMKIFDQFEETAFYHGIDVKKQTFKGRVKELMDFVHLDSEKVMSSYPHELSGGMKQRVMIAFSLLLNPDVIILDEPTTALDVITQDYIFKILQDINETLGITMILLTHDIGVVAKVAHYVGVMYAGRLMEYGDIMTVFLKKMHPYTHGLIRATPSLILDISEMKAIEGTPVNLMKVPSGCVFHPRCEKCIETCKKEVPQGVWLEQNHFVKCHLYQKSIGEKAQ